MNDKGLEALKHLYTRAPATTNAICVMDYEIIQKELEALEVIKSKRVNIEYIKCCENYDQYCLVCSYGTDITKKEYNLLREVLL